MQHHTRLSVHNPKLITFIMKRSCPPHFFIPPPKPRHKDQPKLDHSCLDKLYSYRYTTVSRQYPYLPVHSLRQRLVKHQVGLQPKCRAGCVRNTGLVQILKQKPIPIITIFTGAAPYSLHTNPRTNPILNISLNCSWAHDRIETDLNVEAAKNAQARQR